MLHGLCVVIECNGMGILLMSGYAALCLPAIHVVILASPSVVLIRVPIDADKMVRGKGCDPSKQLHIRQPTKITPQKLTLATF